MDYHIEKEYKLLLKAKDYQRLKEDLDFDEKRIQLNYYYDAHHPQIGLRIRKEEREHTFTLKDARQGFVKEYEFSIATNDLHDPRIKKLLAELKINDPSYLGSLLNTRYIKRLPKGELALDESVYLGQTDHELEYELDDPLSDDRKTLNDLLDKYGLSYIKQASSKYGRFIKRRKSMKVALFLADGHEECEALIIYDLLVRAKINCDLISIQDELVITSSHKVRYYATQLFKDVDLNDYDAIVLPGGLPGTENLFNFAPLKEALLDFHKKGKLLAAICAAPSIFVRLNLVGDDEFTVFPGFEYAKKSTGEKVHQKDNIITAKGLGAAFELAHAIIKELVDEKTADEVLKAIQY